MRLNELPIHIQRAIKGVRDITASDLGPLKRGPNGFYRCRWCLTETKPPRVTWCSSACKKLFDKLCRVRKTIYKRDRGICRICKKDLQDPNNIIPCLEHKQDHSWEIDHIVRVSDGGTTTSDNLWLLCVPCHVVKTRSEVKSDAGPNAKSDGQ